MTARSPWLVLAAAGVAALSCRAPEPRPQPRGLDPVAVGGCFNEEVFEPSCGGAEARPDQPRSLTTVCHRCLEDRHCDERPEGRCVISTDLDGCGVGRRVCLYPGEACYPPSRCPEGQSCYLRGGRASCMAPPPPPA